MAGNVDLKIDVEGNRRVEQALREGLRKALKEAGSELLDKGETFAEDEVAGVREWNSDVKRGFTTEEDRFSRTSHWKGYINNPVKHAKVVDVGLAPAGEITGSDPSVQDIMPWVVDNLRPSSPGDVYGNDSDGGDGDRPGEITDDGRTIQYVDLDELGLRADSFESDDVKAGTLGDGTNVVWKSHNDGPNAQDWKRGIIKNEAAWSKIAEGQGWDIAPRSRLETAETITGETEGTIQEYVTGKQGKKVVYSGAGSRSDFDYTFDEFLSENKDWAAKTAVVDYLAGNDDRHMNNFRVTPDGEPRGIDNGGNQFNEELRGQDLALFSDLFHYYGDEADALYQQNQAMLDRTEELLDEIANSKEKRQSIINTVKGVHGEGSREHDRIIKLLGDEIGEGHILETDDRGIPRYKIDIQNVRQRHERSYNGGEPFRLEEDVTVMGPDDPDSTEEEEARMSDVEVEDYENDIDETLNSLFGDDNKEE